MKFVRVKPDKKILEATASRAVCSVVFGKKYEICIIAGLEGDELACYAVFSHIPGTDAEMYMEYLYTVPEFREQGRIWKLLEYCESYLAGIGVRIITSRIDIVHEYALEYNSFMTRNGFIPLNLTGRILVYDLKDMLGAETIQTVLKGMHLLPPVKRINEIDKKHINAFLDEENHTGFYFYREECDECYSRFYEADQKIHGAMIASMPVEGTLDISAIYIDALAKKNNMFLPLFCGCIEPLISKASQEKITIIINLNDEVLYNGMLKIFNPPECERLVLEHMKYIAGR